MGRNSGGVMRNDVRLKKSYTEFLKKKPNLYGSISVNGKQKNGMFRPEFNPYSDAVDYHYYTAKGHKGTGGFTISKAYKLFSSGQLSTRPIKGSK
jgi:hypothetical protein